MRFLILNLATVCELKTKDRRTLVAKVVGFFPHQLGSGLDGKGAYVEGCT